jgi:hypothetical protein
VDYVGHFIASKIELLIDEQPLQTITGDWMHINYNINLNEGQERGYNRMIGNVSELTTPSGSLSGYRLYIPIPFYFHKSPSLALPLIAMFNSKLHLKVMLQKLERLLHITPSATVSTRGDMKMTLVGRYVYLGDVERKLFAESRHEYIIEQIQYREKSVLLKSVNDKIHFMNPIKDVFFLYQSEESLLNKQYDNYTIVENENPIERVMMRLNGHERFDCEGLQTGVVYPYDRYKTTFTPGLNVYPFCRYPEEGQPSGYCNMTYITDKEMVYELSEAKDGVIKMFGRTYNMLRIMGGIAGIGF